MMEQKIEKALIAFVQPSGDVGFTEFVVDDGRNIKQEPTDENIEAILRRTGHPFVSWRIIDPSDLPQDRTHRDAWKDEGGKIVVDKAKAAAIDEKRKLDEAVKAALKAQHDALVESVKASLK